MNQFVYLENIENSSKPPLDQYYTEDDLAWHCINAAKNVLRDEHITEIVDPSAGQGAFSKKIDGCIAYDIDPRDPSIIRHDFLELDLGYKKGRLFITNPPFGIRMMLVKKFFKKFVREGDYIALILPISQLNNEYSAMFEFDLIHSEDLGVRNYSGRRIHCCFNVYKRPEGGLNKMLTADLRDITILKESSSRFAQCVDYDVRMCYWGNSSAGKIIRDASTHYSAEWKIVIHNSELREKIIGAIERANWHQEIPKTAMLKIQKYHLIKYLKREIPEIN